MKKHYSIFVLFSVLLIGCSSSKPEDRLLDFLNAQKNFNNELAYSLLTEEDKNYKPYSEFNEIKGKDANLIMPLMSKLADHVKFEVLSIEDQTDTAFVLVKETAVNIDRIMKSVFGFGDMFTMMALNEKERIELIEDKLSAYIDKKEELPFNTSEKKYTLIKENGDYKVFMNYALPHKTEELNMSIADLKKNFRYDEALDLVNNFLSKNDSEEIRKVREYLEEMKASTTMLNTPITIGSLEFIPLTIAVQNIEYFKKSWNRTTKKNSNEKYFVMEYKVKNISKAQVFAPRDFSSWTKYNYITDNDGNEMKVANLGYGSYVDSNKKIKLQPGDKTTFHAVCKSPANENANHYLWTVLLRVNNQEKDYTQNIRIKFTKDEFEFL